MPFFDRLKASSTDEWRAYTQHPFTDAMADGSLPKVGFQHYLVQDYLFLIEFARAYGLAVYKAPSLADMRDAAAGISAILDVEMDLHVKLCGEWGLSSADIEVAPAAAETLAYTRYVLDTGMRGDLLALKVALSPCVIGYAEIATRLAKVPGALDDDNPYRVWIGEYAGEAYQQIGMDAVSSLNNLAERYLTPARGSELTTIFREATRLEADFWDMGWNKQSAQDTR
jgi:thiaminase/transcriptional activator TenA